MKVAQRLALQYARAKYRWLSFLSPKKAAESALTLFRTPQGRNNKPHTKIFSEAEKLQFSLDGIMVHGYRWNAGAKKKILILHGYESAVSNFDEYISALVQRGDGVLAFDAPGHGNSEGTTISVPQYAEMIRVIYEQYGPVNSFMAHSLGGLAVCLALEKIPHNEDTRLALIAPAAETTTAVEQFFSLLHLDQKTRIEFDILLTKFGGHPAAWYSIRRMLKNIRASVCWYQDEDDQQTPLSDAMKVKNENHPNLHFVITQGLGHSRIYRDAGVRDSVLKFL